MPKVIDNQSTGDDYTNACTIQGLPDSNGGYYVVANQPVYMQVSSGPVGQQEWSREFPVNAAVGAGAIAPHSTGVRFRSRNVGSPALVTAVLFSPGEPAVTGSTFTGTVSSTGQVTVSNVGSELDYQEQSSQLTVTATTEGTAQTVITGASVAYDGSTKVWIDFGCVYVAPPSGAGAGIFLILKEDGNSLGYLAQVINPAAATMAVPIERGRRRTPAAGSHTYSVAAFVSSGSGTVQAGVGGAGMNPPASLRITVA